MTMPASSLRIREKSAALEDMATLRANRYTSRCSTGGISSQYRRSEKTAKDVRHARTMHATCSVLLPAQSGRRGALPGCGCFAGASRRDDKQIARRAFSNRRPAWRCPSMTACCAKRQDRTRPDGPRPGDAAVLRGKTDLPRPDAGRTGRQFLRRPESAGRTKGQDVPVPPASGVRAFRRGSCCALSPVSVRVRAMQPCFLHLSPGRPRAACVRRPSGRRAAGGEAGESVAARCAAGVWLLCRGFPAGGGQPA